MTNIFCILSLCIMLTESKGGKHMIGKNGDHGFCGAKEIMVNDANRICRLNGEPERFTLASRFDMHESLDMCRTVLKHYRCTTFKRAAKVWNRGGDPNYERKLKREYAFLKRGIYRKEAR